MNDRVVTDRKNGNYDDWSKKDLVDEIKKLKKRKKYGVVWDIENTKEQFEKEAEGNLPILKEIKNKEIRTDKTKPINILIEGDNYHALSVLNYTHKGAVDVIYIDPPYNTGNGDSFRYNDKIVDKEDAYRHSKWLSFMSKRLRLTKNILKNNGVILISIDDNEVAQLKLLCDEIFGEDNLISILAWNLGSGTSAGHFTRSHEYIVCFSKNKKTLPWFRANELGSNIIERAVKRPSRKNPVSDITFPKGMEFHCEDKVFPKKFGKSEPIEVVKGVFEARGGKLAHDVTLKAGWTMRDQIESWLSGQETIDSKGQRVVKFFFKENGVLQYEKERGTVHPKTIITGFTTKQGTQEVENIFGKRVFEFPKPSGLIKYLLEISTNKNSVVVDFFAGSGTTGHAILELNKEDGGKRNFILCTNDENNICTDVCYPRVDKIINGYTNLKKEKVSGAGGNLKYFKTSFVEGESTDKNKRKLVDQSTEMLCLKESCFDEVKTGKYFKIFKNNEGNYLGIIYDDGGIEELKAELKKMNKKINVYVFSLDENAREEEFEDVIDLVTLKPIPEVILNVYRRIFK